MYYVYLYLDPRETIDLIIEGTIIKNKIIYVGKGKNNRIHGHLRDSNLKDNNLKNNTIKKLIKLYGIDTYKKFIIKVEENMTNEEALKLELEVMLQIGTVLNIHPIIKKGTLLNMTICGIVNPIMMGENNPMYNKSVEDVWNLKYSKEKVLLLKKERSIKQSKRSKDYFKKLKKDTEKYNDFINNCKINNFWNTASDIDKEKRKKEISNFFKGKVWYDFIKDPIEIEIKKEKKKQKLKQAYNKKSIKEKQTIIDKIKRNSIYNKYKNLFEYQKEILGIEEATKRKTEGIEKSKKGIQLYWKNLSEDEKFKRNEKFKITNKFNYNKFKNSLSSLEYDKWVDKHRKGKNNPMYNNGHKIKGPKNGRALRYIIHFPTGEKYFCHGTFKSFCKNVLSEIKPMPHRKYFSKSIDNDEVIDGWYFKKVDENFNTKNYIIYEN